MKNILHNAKDLWGKASRRTRIFVIGGAAILVVAVLSNCSGG